MSLSFRLNMLIVILLAALAAAGLVTVVRSARTLVAEEIDSTVNLTLQLLVAATIAADPQNQRVLRAALIERLASLERVRHLDIVILGSDGRAIGPMLRASEPDMLHAPRWFARLVTPPPVEYRHRLSGPGIPYTEIAIRADPSAEIADAWNESRTYLMLLTGFAALVAALVYLTIARAFRPIGRILEALSVIERGNYDARLGEFALPEMKRIAREVNRMGEALRRKEQENRAWRKRGLAIQEAERRHLSRELHDELGQSISAIKALAVSITRSQVDAQEAQKNSAAEIVAICNHVYDVVQGMMRRLRPAVLDELGLETALSRAIDDWSAHFPHIRCKFTVSGDVSGLGNEVGINVYRIVQECLTNVVRHAGASEVKITLATVADANTAAPALLRLQVSDDGVGFDAARPLKGFGLTGIRERVESMDGSMEIRTGIGAGTRIDVTIPLDRPAIAGARDD